MPAQLTDYERLMAKVEKRADGCWIWTASRNNGGYGIFKFRGRQNFQAHRASYILHKGEIPEGLQLDHLCNRPSCVNPDHLEAVTGAENTRRARERRQARHSKRSGPDQGLLRTLEYIRAGEEF